MEADKVVDNAYFGFTLLVSIGTDDGIAALGRLILNTIKNRGIVVAHEVWHNDTNHPRRFFAQTLGKGIGTVVQLTRQRLYALLHLLTDLR